MNKIPNATRTSRSTYTLSGRLGVFLATTAGIVLCLGVISVFNLETDLQLRKLFGIAGLGFCVHYWLRPAWKMPFLLFMNLSAIIALFGVWPGGVVIIFSLALFSTLNLSSPIYQRALFSAGIGLALVLGKMQWYGGSDLSLAATVVGGLFMFRALVFLYETYHTPGLGSFWERISYFFLLPNLIFVIFPVVDLKTFLRTYERSVEPKLYVKGLWWIMRGLLHLLVYRLIYYFLVPAPTDVQGFFGVLTFIVTSYLLIVRLSGIFHLSVGILCLFGCNLPPTFDNYFLATGFSDLWRRINIYWRDFMMKVFYFPIYFRFKRRNTGALVASILIVFAINWLLHQYQYFWIQGTFPLTAVDVVFWLGFGALVTVNSVLQMRYRSKKKADNHFSRSVAAITSLQVIGTFLMMSLLWSFWTSPSIAYWITFLKRGLEVSGPQILLFLGIVASLCCAGVITAWLHHLMKKKELIPTPVVRLTAYGVFWLAAVTCLQSPVAVWLEDRFDIDLGPVREQRLNAMDAERRFEGYYETLLTGKDLAAVGLSPTAHHASANWKNLKSHGVIIASNDDFDRRGKPNQRIMFKGAEWSTNAHGLRDREYTKTRPATTFRIALLGGSIEMGTGVGDEETFENLAENALNAPSERQECRPVEILNFSLSGMQMLNQAQKVREALEYDPQLIIYALHEGETVRGLKSFIQLYRMRNTGSYPELFDIFARAGLGTEDDDFELERKLRGVTAEITVWIARRIAGIARQRDVSLAVLYVPVLGERRWRASLTAAEMKNIFREAGYSIMDIQHAYDGRNPEDFRIAPDDSHPNAEAHRLLGAAFRGQLLDNPDITKLRCDL